MSPGIGTAALIVAAVSIAALLPCASGQQTLKLSATLTLEKGDDKMKTYEQVSSLLETAKEKKLEPHVQRFLENMIQQLQKVLDTAKIIEEQKGKEVPKDFTPTKYRVKPMPKLQTKKVTTKKISAKDLQKRLKEGKSMHFDEPMLVTNATALFEGEAWNNLRRHWSAGRISADEQLEKNLRLEYWPPDKARARMVGNMFQMEEPEMVAFSRYLVICHYGTPAKPKLPGQNTDHCEQTVEAQRMVHNSSELEELKIFPELKNALPLQAEFRQLLYQAGEEEIILMLGKKGAQRWKRESGGMSFRHFTFGPSGSGDKLHAENGLPFFDVLIHGSRRWLLLKEDEMQRVADKAKEALEFQKTSAYMFFEEKLPELKEEFGLKKYVEANQNPGDLIIVPSGWFRVSLSLADSISYYETVLSEKDLLKIVTDQQIWKPQFQRYQLAFCYDSKDLYKLPGIEAGSEFANWLSNAISQVKHEEKVNGILNVLFQCGSVLALDPSFPDFKVSSLTMCHPDVWKQCRSQLEVTLKKKGVRASLDWLPKKAPKSKDDIKVFVKTEGKADEL
jgi:hypothetical protein